MIRKSLQCIVLLLIGISTVQAQSFDYEERPRLNFDFTEAHIDIRLNPEEATLNGSVMYRFKAKINGVDMVQLDAPGITVDSVRADGQPLRFEIEDGKLAIDLPESSEIGTQYAVELFYRAAPPFGMLKSASGAMWTSMLPQTTRRWVPVRDHPRVQLITTLSLQVPANYTVFGSGVRTEREILSTDTQKVTFRTGQPIPVTSLAFGLGSFREEGSSMGIKRINSYAEPGAVSSAEQAALVDSTKKILAEVGQATGINYPYQRLNVVVLNDHYWEQKPYGASTIFLYKNRGDWVNQLRRGLYAQWAGVLQQEEQWAASWPIQLLQTGIHRSVKKKQALLAADRDEPATSFTTVYDQFSTERWNQWQNSDLSSASMRQLTEQLIPQILSKDSPIITPEIFDDFWYRLSGQPRVDASAFITDTQSSLTGSKDTVRYRLDYLPQPGSNTLTLAFNAQKRSLQQPTQLPLIVTSNGNTTEQQITFAGSTDTVSVTIPAGTRNAEITVPEKRSLIFEEHKPVDYLLYQIRNGATVASRRKAAQQLGYHTDNPDLQLALTDLMSREMAPEVEAALLRSYGKITAGADGTQQRFLEALQSNEPEVRAAALDVLGNYEDSNVSDQLKNYARQETNSRLSNKALERYMQQIDSTAALTFTNTLVQQDTSGTKAIVAIQALAERGNTVQAIKLAGFYIEPVYDYSVRKKAFQVLLNQDKSAENWSSRLEIMLSDYDPRMRYLAVKNLDVIPGIDGSTVISSHIEQEYDARVLEEMNNTQ